MRISIPAPLLAVSLFAFPFSSSGQNVSLDEGAFRLSVNGELTGREEFSIRRTGIGEGAQIVLRGTIERDDPGGNRGVTTVMSAVGNPPEVQQYQVRVTGPGATEIYVARTGARYMARVVSSEGEQVREFRAGPGSVLLDREVAHHYFLLSPFLDQGSAVSLTVLSPQMGRQLRLTLTLLGEEEVQIGGSLYRTRHFRLEGDGDPREVWFDDQGRVLRMELPGTGYVAEREAFS